ncbi:TPA: NAD(+) synthetase [Patescibacteria group bacterium]|uniref:NH(3)-dependent NAD(+) synthetase n=1 Tax=Candidatus Gottesmanbacteria bacterium GW2011_GWA1_43_11 TaxID=1618436 RepID=A0A0G1FFI0_9BACT|nr:MAG: NH(3)-dependent NAD(+) synthetase [Candidatus Gottesmanbacteria bacterium GW2011_GWA1_43_11]HCS79218.1 NAD(+) synthetase [Patescibacteria group bacterium]
MRNLNIPKTAIELTRFIKTTVSTAGFQHIVVAVSGGVDSATSISLATKALGKENVYALLLPYNNWHDTHMAHARLLLQQLQIPDSHITEVDIAPMVDSFSSHLQLTTYNPQPAHKVRIGNIMARVRMIVLFDFAKKLNALVCGTENKSEHYLGYFTRFGDEASDLEPLRNLYKTEVYELAKYLHVPEEILTKAPTAGLWSGQTDEGQFGFSYKDADEVLYQLYDLKKSEAEIVASGVSNEIVAKVKKWVDSVSFKHHLPYVAPEPASLT